MLLAAFLRAAVDLKLIRDVIVRHAVPPVLGRVPGAVPSRSTPRPRVDVNGFLARVEAIAVVVAADTDGTVTLARPGVEDAPSATVTDIFASLRGVGRRSLGRPHAWLHRRHRRRHSRREK